jgi:hypothetical protein
MMRKYMNVMKLAVVGLIFSTSFVTLANTATIQKTATSKNSNLGNVVKATILSVTSLAGIMIYYEKIIKPYVIHLAATRGLDYAIQFNKDFVLNHPGLAALYATPLFLGIFHAILARDYVQKILNKVEDAE